MHLILAIFIALVLFRWVCTKPRRKICRSYAPIRGEVEITVIPRRPE